MWLEISVTILLMLVVSCLYLVFYIHWERRNTRGMAYYGRTLAGRRALKARIRLYSLPARPLVSALALCHGRNATMPAFEFKGVCGPPGVSSPEMFERATNYQPRREDVFIATQMRCGTTWMQQLVYEIANRGRGDLSDKGNGHLYAMSPWIEAVNSVPLDNAPLVGKLRIRIIKTHLPTTLCPYGEQAKYIYVTRHPVSCFASIVDYNRTLLGPLMPNVDRMADWFCSERMYWSPWPEHVTGWWHWSNRSGNVVFAHYEEMTLNFSSVLERIASFLGIDDLTADEKRRIVEKCSFKYMQNNDELFEMAPPNMFSAVGGRLLRSGKANRRSEVIPAVRDRILYYCRQSLQRSDYPAKHFYPDIIAPALFEDRPLDRAPLEPSHT